MAKAQRKQVASGIREPRQTAESWKESYDLLLEGFPDAVYIYDAGGKVIAANGAAARLSGFDRQALPGTDFRQLLTPDSWARLSMLMESGAASQRFSMDAEMVTRRGALSGVELRATLQHRPGGGPVVHCVARETAPKKSAEKASRRGETRFRLMANNPTEMVLAYDMDRRLTFANAAAQTLTGYSAADLEREQFICWVHPEDRERMLGHWDKLFEGESFDDEYRLISKDGSMKWVAASWGPILDDSGRQIGVQGRERDITERRTAEETLRQSEHRLRLNEERYRALFENSPVPMWEKDFSSVKECIDGLAARGITDLRSYLAQDREAVMECVRRVKVLDVNRAARQFYGVEDKRELLGDLNKVFDEGTYAVFRDEVAALVEGQSVYQAEFQLRTLRDEERTVNMTVSLAPSPGNDWSRVIVTFFDLTDRRRLEEELVQSQKLDSLGRLAGGIAHDFNNLLMVIAGYSDLLLGSLDNKETLRHGLQEIKNAGERGGELTQQLLAFSRKQVTQPRALNLNAVIQESQGLLQRVIGEDIRLKIALDPGLWTVKADRGQMNQVLMNLVANGREAMPEGGVLTVLTRNVFLGSDLHEEPEEAGAEPYVLLRIQDTGLGMDERTRKHVFEPFFTTKGRGTGLGLATVFGIVAQSGGHISVESEIGRGSTFSLYFPRMADGGKEEEPAGEPRSAAKGSGTVLVVEDQDEVRRLTSTILRGLGFDVLEASDGMEAMLVAADYKQPIRLLVTDVIMPGINGRELARSLVELRPEMLVIYMSGYTDRIMSKDGVLDSSVAYLQKPFTPEMLTQMVLRVLGDNP